MITLTLTTEQARVLLHALSTASNCCAEFPQMDDNRTLIERIAKQISDQLPEAGSLESQSKVKYTVEPESRNNNKPNRI